MANALVKLDAPKETKLAIVPMGTANDFATGLGIPDEPWEALQLAVHDTFHAVDVGLVNDQVQACIPSCSEANWKRPEQAAKHFKQRQGTTMLTCGTT